MKIILKDKASFEYSTREQFYASCKALRFANIEYTIEDKEADAILEDLGVYTRREFK